MFRRVLIGVATVSYFVLTGRYAGISGILPGAAFGEPDRLMDALGGAVIVTVRAFRFVPRMARPIFDKAVESPAPELIDAG